MWQYYHHHVSTVSKCGSLDLSYAYNFFSFPVALRPHAGHGLLILEVSRSHTTTHHSRWDSSGRVISSSQRPLPDNTQCSQQMNIHAPGGIRTHDLSRRATADLRLRPRGQWDRQNATLSTTNPTLTRPCQIKGGHKPVERRCHQFVLLCNAVDELVAERARVHVCCT